MSTELIVDVTGEEAQVKSRVVPVVPSASLDAITGVRFLAAAGVVFYHFRLPIVKPKSLLLSNLVGAGYTAVTYSSFYPALSCPTATSTLMAGCAAAAATFTFPASLASIPPISSVF